MSIGDANNLWCGASQCCDDELGLATVTQWRIKGCDVKLCCQIMDKPKFKIDQFD
uniref:Uncharacterized protein n=1 Tax=Aquilaria malaccensis TaxID=223753 RepID=A0A4Y6GN33_9ROSI|nr:hypothetical protein [Aquilaria malaccensis]